MESLNKETAKPDFWKNSERAAEVQRKISEIKNEIEDFKRLKTDLERLKKTVAEGNEAEAQHQREALGAAVEKEEIKTFFSGKYDKNNAILQIFSGAGGVDAQDWATMLLRMYERYCAAKGFQTKVLHQAFGEGGGPEGRIGTKSATLEIKGQYAFGFLKKETGVHRLVRISPFSAQKLRHTSFALIEVLPEVGQKKEKEIEIKPDELKIETFKSSGPGGQYVNKRESAIRITHLPTGIVVSSQSERLQGANRENAMKILYAKLSQLKEEKQQKEIEKIKGKKTSVSWGNQIRSYVLHPYKIVKDLRTGLETSDIEKVLDGGLDEFVEAEVRISR